MLTLLVTGTILFVLWALGLVTRRSLGGGDSCIGRYCSYSHDSLDDICGLLAIASNEAKNEGEMGAVR
jgi:hypothetical protein